VVHIGNRLSSEIWFRSRTEIVDHQRHDSIRAFCEKRNENKKKMKNEKCMKKYKRDERKTHLFDIGFE
jgi:hypothetical protein